MASDCYGDLMVLSLLFYDYHACVYLCVPLCVYFEFFSCTLGLLHLYDVIGCHES